ncbi:Uncharacterized protein SCF082_LOCUS45962 [Durusdinium trenchii]|uniref:Uncharacterized protein n=1 Tax=Durusdinium trenchii TaxID=1381693 RepID=A0ABP0REN5_9DINO
MHAAGEPRCMHPEKGYDGIRMHHGEMASSRALERGRAAQPDDQRCMPAAVEASQSGLGLTIGESPGYQARLQGYESRGETDTNAGAWARSLADEGLAQEDLSQMPLWLGIETRTAERHEKPYDPEDSQSRSFASHAFWGRRPRALIGRAAARCADGSQQLIDEKNTACSFATYEGGYRCCEHGVFLTEGPHPAGPLQQIEAKFTFEFYEPDAPEVKTARPTMQPSCCDATGGYLSNSSYFANLEYDIPQCSPGTPPEQCEHVISSVEYFDVPSSNSSDPNEEFELVHAWGHQHVGGNGLELYKDSTGELLCRSHPKYGTGEQAGDEKGFVVGFLDVSGYPALRLGPSVQRHLERRT